jgi:Sodium/hydrogen exchanger family
MELPGGLVTIDPRHLAQCHLPCSSGSSTELTGSLIVGQAMVGGAAPGLGLNPREQFGFDLIPGVFAAGMVVGLASRGVAGKPLRHKVEAICFGFLVPFFFVTSGIKFDLTTLLHNAQAMLLLPAFLILLFIVRGVPVFLHRHDLAKGQRLPFALYSATALPLLVAISAMEFKRGACARRSRAALVERECCPYCSSRLSPVFYCLGLFELRPGTKLT